MDIHKTALISFSTLLPSPNPPVFKKNTLNSDPLLILLSSRFFQCIVPSLWNKLFINISSSSFSKSFYNNSKFKFEFIATLKQTKWDKNIRNICDKNIYDWANRLLGLICRCRWWFRTATECQFLMVKMCVESPILKTKKTLSRYRKNSKWIHCTMECIYK